MEGSTELGEGERMRIMAENRLKAKAKQQERDRLSRAAQTSSDTRNSNFKRPLQVASADSTSPTAPNTRTNPSINRGTTRASSALQNAIASGSGSGNASGSGSNDAGHFKRGEGGAPAPLRNMIGTYVEYDLATLKNSRGGFLLDSEEDDPRKIKEREIIEENKRKRMENLRKANSMSLPGNLDRSQMPKCEHCGTFEIDVQFRGVFGVLVCAKCKVERPDEYSLLTKTECKEDYLLTDPELKDAELLPHLLKPNPHRPTYSNMMLFLRKQVEAFAFSDKKWGSAEALDEEFARREAEKKEKKSKKFEKKLKELRKKTSTNVWHRRMDGEHKHVFEDGEEEGTQRCSECGFEVEVEVF